MENRILEIFMLVWHDSMNDSLSRQHIPHVSVSEKHRYTKYGLGNERQYGTLLLNTAAFFCFSSERHTAQFLLLESLELVSLLQSVCGQLFSALHA